MGECWNCNATADDDWSCQACRTERNLAESLAAADREVERLRAERDAWKTAAIGASTQTVRLREQIIEWAKSLNEADVPRTAAEDALLSVAYGDYSARPSLHEATYEPAGLAGSEQATPSSLPPPRRTTVADGGKEYRLVDLLSFTDEHFALHPWIKSLEEAREDDYYLNYLFLYNGNTPVRYIAEDGGEPEDQTFRRDWSWVVRELNAALAAATKEDDR